MGLRFFNLSKNEVLLVLTRSANKGSGDTPEKRKTPCFRSSRCARQKGSAIIETALLLPVLILMAVGTMDLARVFFAGIVVESAARAGVQMASFSVGKAGAFSETNAAAQADASGQGITGITTSSRTFCGCNNSTSEVSCSTGTCTVNGVSRSPSGYVETTASYTFAATIPYPGIPRNIVLSSTAKFRAQ
jgi:Flp pilus assembly protein TadG